MHVIPGAQALSHDYPHPIVCIGNFDGVHLGHQAIIAETLALARAKGGTAVVYTFNPHPRVALSPDYQLQLLTTYEERNELLAAAGVDVVVEEPFIREFSTIGYEQFFSEYLLRALNAEAIVVGYDFAFGRQREGHLQILESLCRQNAIPLTIVQPKREDGEIVSSSRIRLHCLAGEIEKANRLLGRPFSYRGIVIKGDQRGRTLGFPTANLAMGQKLALPNGVYATRALIRSVLMPGVTNIGLRPTFVSGQPEVQVLLETYVLDRSDLDLYGTEIEVQFVHRLRDEERFQSVEELVAKIGEDIREARRIFVSLS